MKIYKLIIMGHKSDLMS